MVCRIQSPLLVSFLQRVCPASPSSGPIIQPMDAALTQQLFGPASGAQPQLNQSMPNNVARLSTANDFSSTPVAMSSSGATLQYGTAPGGGGGALSRPNDNSLPVVHNAAAPGNVVSTNNLVVATVSGQLTTPGSVSAPSSGPSSVGSVVLTSSDTLSVSSDAIDSLGDVNVATASAGTGVESAGAVNFSHPGSEDRRRLLQHQLYVCCGP